METQSLRLLKIIAGLIVITGVFYFGYTYVSVPLENIEPTVKVTAGGAQSGPSTDLVTLLENMKKINMKENAKVLDTPAYMALADMSVTISEQPLGRKNPFAPLFAVPVDEGLVGGTLPVRSGPPVPPANLPQSPATSGTTPGTNTNLPNLPRLQNNQ